MEGKILLYIRDFQSKRKIINAVSELRIPFIECYSEEEFGFKKQLIDEPNKVFVYEFSDIDMDKQFANIKNMKNEGWRIIAIFSQYKKNYINMCREAGIEDLIVYPVDISVFRKKLVTLFQMPTVERQLPVQEGNEPELKLIQRTENKEDEKQFMDMIRLEINRAKRGSYDLSFIMIDLGDISDNAKTVYLEQLNGVIRETDSVTETNFKNCYMVVCPFTPKNFLVEVENKVRNIYTSLQRQGSILPMNKVYLHGLTYGVDGDGFDVVYDALIDKINRSKEMDREIMKSGHIGNSKLKSYQNINKKSHR